MTYFFIALDYLLRLAMKIIDTLSFRFGFTTLGPETTINTESEATTAASATTEPTAG